MCEIPYASKIAVYSDSFGLGEIFATINVLQYIQKKICCLTCNLFDSSNLAIPDTHGNFNVYRRQS